MFPLIDGETAICPSLRVLKINTKTNTAQGLLKYDEDGGGDDGEEEGARDHFGSGEGEDGRDPLDPELVCLRKSIRKNVRCVCEVGKYGSAAGRPPPLRVLSVGACVYLLSNVVSRCRSRVAPAVEKLFLA